MSKDTDYIKSIDSAERRFFSTKVSMEKREEGKTPKIEGMAALFNVVTRIGDWFEEEVMPGAFDDVINDDVRCLFNHNPNYVLARSVEGKGTLALSLTAEGLKYSYETPNRSYAKDLEDAIESGDISGSSFAFRIKEQKWISRKDDIDLRQIVKFERLLDVSPVTYPAYPDATVGKRSLDAFKAEDNIEEIKTKTVREAQLIINKNRK
jgi:HK97 family phage prohead protease|tara:strand:- start:73 stop:696 length:624 start_codon:yes stop_codon:yes gene_type:complete